MIQLEQTIITLARQRLDAVRSFYAKQSPTEEDQNDFQSNFAAMNALIELGHMADGVSQEASRELLAIEEQAAAAFRAAEPEAQNGDATSDGQPERYTAKISIDIEGASVEYGNELWLAAVQLVETSAGSGNGVLPGKGKFSFKVVETGNPNAGSLQREINDMMARALRGELE